MAVYLFLCDNVLKVENSNNWQIITPPIPVLDITQLTDSDLLTNYFANFVFECCFIFIIYVGVQNISL